MGKRSIGSGRTLLQGCWNVTSVSGSRAWKTAKVGGCGLACANFLPMRVIAGSLRSRRLRVPPKGVRPTSDRVREAMFSALGDLSEARVLDLFAGSGALGIEALSRGASSCVFVERSRASLAVLESNRATLGLGEVSEVLALDALRALPLLARRGLCVDLVLLDPPYDADLVAPALAALRDVGLVSQGGVVVVERSKRNPIGAVEGWQQDRERQYGQTIVNHLRLAPARAGGDAIKEAVAKAP